jgi:hypothetical protein
LQQWLHKAIHYAKQVLQSCGMQSSSIDTENVEDSTSLDFGNPGNVLFCQESFKVLTLIFVLSFCS